MSHCIKIPKICNKSLKYTVKLDTINSTPIDTTNWIATITKYHNILNDSPIPPKITNPKKDISYITGANHGYTDKEQEVAEQMLKFIANV